MLRRIRYKCLFTTCVLVIFLCFIYRVVYVPSNLNKENLKLAWPDAAISSNGMKALLTERTITDRSNLFRDYRPDLKSEKTFEVSQDFQVIHTNSSIYVYSAYFNEILSPAVVTVVAIVNRTDLERRKAWSVTCLYSRESPVDSRHFNGSKEFAGHTVTGKIVIMPDHHGAIFSPSYIHCPLPQNYSVRHPLNFVSIATNQTKTIANFLKIQYPQPRQWKFVMCFSPLHGNFNDAVQIVQNLEMAQLLGADHAVVYNSSITDKVSKVLTHYVRKDFLEVKRWRHVPEPIHYQGQMGAINDCLLQNRNSSDYIVFLDFDEMIVPRFHNSWSEMLEYIQEKITLNETDLMTGSKILSMPYSLTSVQSQSKQKHDGTSAAKSASNANLRDHHGAALSASSRSAGILGAFAFPSSVFLWDTPTNLTSSDLNFARLLQLSFLMKQKRISQIWPHRSKAIVKPKSVETMGIHNAIYFVKGQKGLMVNESLGLLQHYRWYSSKVSAVKDASILRFASPLIKRIKITLLDLEAAENVSAHTHTL